MTDEERARYNMRLIQLIARKGLECGSADAFRSTLVGIDVMCNVMLGLPTLDKGELPLDAEIIADLRNGMDDPPPSPTTERE